MSELDPFLQIRTTRGQVPCRSVLPIADGAVATDRDSKEWQAFRFEPMSVDEARAADASDGASASADGITLLELAECVMHKTIEPESDDAGDAPGEPVCVEEISGKDLYRFAQHHGPLFGTSAEEPVEVTRTPRPKPVASRLPPSGRSSIARARRKKSAEAASDASAT